MNKILALFLLVPIAAVAAERYTPPPKSEPKPPSPPAYSPLKWENVLEANQATNVDVSTGVVVTSEVGSEASVGDITTTATGGAGGAGGQATGGTATVGDITGGNVGDITMNGGGININHPRQVASAYAPAVFPTAICEGGQSLGVQTTKFGVSWTRSDSRREACLFALSQQWMSMGEYELACGALMATRAATHAYGDEKPSCKDRRGPAPLIQPQLQSQPMIIVVPNSSEVNFDEKLKRAFEAAIATPK